MNFRIIFRAFLWWLSFFVIFHVVSVMFAAFGPMIISIGLLVAALSLFYMILSFWFGWLFFRSVAPNRRQVIEISVAWILGFSVLTALLNPILYGMPIHREFSNPVSLVADVLMIMLFALGGFLRLRKNGAHTGAPDLLRADAIASEARAPEQH